LEIICTPVFTLFGEPPRPTGVGDPTVDADNGRGLVAMQWYTLRRFWGVFTHRDGWRLHEVAFDEHFRPVPVDHANLHAFEHRRPMQGEADPV
jgi:hypothetical protein